MSRKHKSGRPVPGASSRSSSTPSTQFTTDSYANFQARLGWGADNLSSASQYALTYQSRNQIWLEAAYRGSWIVGKAVDALAEDMTRAGIEMRGLDPARVTTLDHAITRLGIWESLCDTIKWSRLYGGAIAVMLIEGQDMSTPLRVDAITKGQFKGLMVLDRWMVTPSIGEVITDFGPDMGKPKYYRLVAANTGLPAGDIHHSRVLRFDGIDLPYNQRQSENGWGLSILEPMWDRLVAFDSTSVGIGQLAYKAHLRVIHIEKLREIISNGGPELAGLTKQVEFIRAMQCNEGMTLLDSADKFETHQYGFGGLSDVMIRFAEQLAGAIGTPLTRLFGQSPGGLNATGDGEMRQYHESVKQGQERRMRNPLHLLLSVISMSVFGEPLPNTFEFDFRNLQEMSEIERAEIAERKASALTAVFSEGALKHSTFLKELRGLAQITGLFGNITNEQIDAAEAQESDEPPPPPELDLSETEKAVAGLDKVATNDSFFSRLWPPRR